MPSSGSSGRPWSTRSPTISASRTPGSPSWAATDRFVAALTPTDTEDGGTFPSREDAPMGEMDGARAELETAAGRVSMNRLAWLGEHGVGDHSRLPHTVKILLENLLRRAGTRDVSEDDVRALAGWPEDGGDARIAFMPARILMQDFTGVPAVVDLAAIRSA